MALQRKRLTAFFAIALTLWFYLLFVVTEVINNKSRWTTIDLDSMSSEELFKYMSWKEPEACSWIAGVGGKFVGLHLDNTTAVLDGEKSMCMDDKIAPIRGKCLIYSFGIGNNWSFEELMEQYGCQVYAFDSMMGKADHDRTANIHFYNIGLRGDVRLLISLCSKLWVTVMLGVLTCRTIRGSSGKAQS